MNSNNLTNYGNPLCKIATFKKGKKIYGLDPNEWRKDIFGNIIKFSEHGKFNKHGWHIDHIIPKSKSGSHDISNLQPIQSSKNCSMGSNMKYKDKFVLFKALEDKNNIQYSNHGRHFNFSIGKTCLVKQRPTSEEQLATILSLDCKNKKVKVFWIVGEYQEDIDMYIRLFSDIPCSRNRNKCN